MNTAKLFAFDGRGKLPGASGAQEMEMDTPKLSSALPILPDSATHNTDANYLRSLLERAQITQRGAASLLGMNERSMRYFLNGQREIDYPAQYCLEVLARGGVADGPAPPIWFKASARPLRKDDVGRLLIGRDIAGAYLFGRVDTDGHGMVIEALPGAGVGSKITGASALEDYVLVDDAEPV